MNKTKLSGLVVLSIMLTGSLLISKNANGAVSTITFNDSSYTETNINLGSVTTNARQFQGDANPSIWSRSNNFNNLLDCTPNQLSSFTGTNNTFSGAFSMIVDGYRVVSPPFSLHKCVTQQSLTALQAFAIAQTLPTDNYVVPVSPNVSPCQITGQTLQVTDRFTSDARIHNPTALSITGNITLSIEFRVIISDGATVVDNQRLGFNNYTITNANKGNQLANSAFTTVTTTAISSTSNYIGLNVIYIELVKVTIPSGNSFTTTSYTTVDYNINHDEIALGNGWIVNTGGKTTPFVQLGTCNNPTPSGNNVILGSTTIRSVWNFDNTGAKRGTNINPDGYEGWKWNTGNVLGNTNNTGNTFGSSIFRESVNITRTNVVSQTPPLTIQEQDILKLLSGTLTGSRGACSGLVGTGLVSITAKQTYQLFNPAVSEAPVFSMWAARQNAISNNHDPPLHNCTIRTLVTGTLVTPSGATLQTLTFFNNTDAITTTTPILTGYANSLVAFTPSATAFQYVNLTLNISHQVVTEDTDSPCTGCSFSMTNTFNVWTDSYASNWLAYPIGNSTVQPTLDCLTNPNQVGCTTQPPLNTCASGFVSSNQLICVKVPTSVTPSVAKTPFCTQNPNDPSCQVNPTGGTSGTVALPTGKIGNIACFTNGTISWQQIDLTSTNTASATASQWVNNLMLLIGSCTMLTIPIGVLLIGMGGLAGLLRESAGMPIMAFLAIWALFFSVFGFFPFWIALVVIVAVAGLIIVLIRKGTSSGSGG